ncbi:hypothetical protein BDW59DRAFT_160608 [Aspergillus cavernicola]|uniref:Uncharacterized protein n=1 Tax=Aspergillus cavernicola TaxID=176166 RepID=A0ABR4IGY9_9EURO
MCHIQRVTNTCGHINDHITLSCHLAKDIESSPEPSSPASSPSTVTHQHETKPKGQPTRTTTTTKALTTSTSKPKPNNAPDRIARSGFDARTQPYCIWAKIHELKSAQGFKCMVFGCGRAD